MRSNTADGGRRNGETTDHGRRIYHFQWRAALVCARPNASHVFVRSRTLRTPMTCPRLVLCTFSSLHLVDSAQKSHAQTTSQNASCDRLHYQLLRFVHLIAAFHYLIIITNTFYIRECLTIHTQLRAGTAPGMTQRGRCLRATLHQIWFNTNKICLSLGKLFTKRAP